MQPGLNFNNLKFFYDAVEAESISEAARRNYITQSAVSQGILKLEKALGFPLITHQRNCFKLTPEGQQIFLMAQQIFRTLKSMMDLIQEGSSIISGEINLACTQSIAMNIVSTSLQKLKSDYPKVSMKIKIAKMENICLMLKRGIMDLAMVVESELCDSFEQHVVRKGHFHVYAKKGLKDDLKQGIYVDHVNGLHVDKLQSNFRRKFKIELPIMQELDSWQVLAKCAENGIGYCFLPDFIAEGNPGLVASKSLPGIPYRIVFIYPKGVHLTRAARLLLSLFEL